jgi:hypothetical protein
VSTFKETEKLRQAAFKSASPYFTDAARADGVYAGAPRPFCLPCARAEENLWAGVRADALAYFAANGIGWHDAQRDPGQPHRTLTNHLCGSQVCCVNFLFPFARHPDALAALLRPLFPALTRMIELEPATRPGQFVSHEWIGLRDYLGEAHGGRTRTRGSHATSADAAVMFERADGLRQIVLIEWKYTETYSPADKAAGKSGATRRATYDRFYTADDFPLRKELLPSFAALFYEPFYQLLRQQLLAHEMERARELGADRVSLLHLAPAANPGFQRVTAPLLAPLGATVTGVWARLARAPDRFASACVEDVFGRFPVDEFPAMRPWWEYVSARYPWFAGGRGAAGRAG